MTTDPNAPTKSLKGSHASPMSSRKKFVVMDLKTQQQQRPSFSLPVLAAATLSMAFAHLDHWPTPLVEAYVSDCFGSRSWVDEKACLLLVQNLSLAHSSSGTSMSLTTTANREDLQKDAARVASSYRSFRFSEQQDNSINRKPAQNISSGVPFEMMERSVSTETIDSVVRSQAPYEIDWDDEEDDEADAINSATPSNRPKKRKRKSDDSSSSGGEDEEEVVVLSAESNDDDSKEGLSKPAKVRRKSNAPSSGAQVRLRSAAHYPLEQTRLNLQPVRQRYFGENLQAAHDAVHRALLDRLEQKSRQNSGLLQTLPRFTAVPLVRCVVAENLSRWLQSPALAGLARKLFVELVDKMQNADPPLKEDLQAIDFVLSMKLKANQFSAHIENVTAIASRIPTPTMAQHILTTLMRDSISSSPDGVQGGLGDPLEMVCSVHKALPPKVSYGAAASALLRLLVEAGSSSEGNENAARELSVLKLRQIIQKLSKTLGASFDCSRLMEALLSQKFDKESRIVKNEEDKARLMFQCVTLHASPSSAGTSSKITKGTEESQEKEAKRKSLHKARKSLLGWCCTDYGPRWSAGRKRRRENDDDLKAGAGTPNYRSALGPLSAEESIPSWLNNMRCLLFLEEANSDLMSHFLAPSQANVGGENVEAKEQERIRACCAYGADIDNDMVRIVLKAYSPREGSLPAEMAIQLLEHLFESCGRTSGTSLRVSDPELIWELYKLVLYVPPKSLLSGKKIDKLVRGGRNKEEEKGSLPRLAYPGFWWRVTMLGLVMSGASPEKIGEVVWREHPTLRALMKMITSVRYRFPTVDCDDVARELMKKEEHDSREYENQIAEVLFLKPKRQKEVKNGKTMGSRVSRRLLKRQEEKEAAAALAENNKRKKMLKSAQKSIMLWDPDGPARKPPRESADLLLSVEKMFGLSAAFQRSIAPDFVLLTIGETTRGAIERAYDWLIPIISNLPELISRLPSSASCFLLLRAYGTDTGDKSQLKKLSAPLLSHVKESLRGEYGEDDCTNAFELLMSDAASFNADRRMSARRVLQDSLGASEGPSEDSSSWMHKVLIVEHSKSLVRSAIKHMSKAATYERGKVLKSLVFALNEYISYAEKEGLENEVRFPVLLAGLISLRPSVYAEALDRFSDLLELVVSVMHGEISRLASVTGTQTDGAQAIIWLDVAGTEKEARVSLDLLQSCCVLLSIWDEESADTTKDDGEEKTKESDPVQDLVQALLKPNERSPDRETLGLAGAKYIDTDELAVSVESVSFNLSISTCFVLMSLADSCVTLVPVDYVVQGAK